MAGNEAGHGAIVRNRDLIDVWKHREDIENKINNDSEENTSSDEEQEPPCRSVGRPRVPFEQASKKTKRRRVAELTTDRSANELQFAVNVVSGRNYSRSFKKENADLVRNTEKEIITKIENLIPIEIKTKEDN
ncbi:unnamed protein product [Acanthoscelides obtectus]|uniref:Uncharacterized protein n=1 Tax=Acanthoscelides obtectus TaxID=200917 RepID=A0A9P0LC91_ACAOB|nr:unnamed protein product [Acanthoscelides obtectus]CAK1660299.1 hypothetical protein AOBTE_LOCUS21972 [Acanthoscelides obtectus]